MEEFGSCNDKSGLSEQPLHVERFEKHPSPLFWHVLMGRTFGFFSHTHEGKVETNMKLNSTVPRQGLLDHAFALPKLMRTHGPVQTASQSPNVLKMTLQSLQIAHFF